MDVESISILLFLVATSILLWLDRKNVEFSYGIALRKTKKGVRLLEDFTKKHRKLLKYLGNLSLVVGIAGMLFGFYFLLNSSYQIISKPKKVTPTIKMVFPKVPGVKYPSFVQGVPFWYWIIAIIVVVSVHEPMHALMALLYRIRVKSLGMIFLGPLPIGAFADPDEEQMKRLRWINKIKVYAAGSFGNLIAALVSMLLFICIINITTMVIQPVGIGFEKTINGTPADKINLSGVILEINGSKITSLQKLAEVLASIPPGSNITIRTTKGNYTIKTIPNPDNKNMSFIGIKSPTVVFIFKNTGKKVASSTLAFISWFLGLFNWLFIINLGIGIVNLLPLKPLDGGLIMDEIIKRYVKKKHRKLLSSAIFWLTFGLLFFNLFGPSLLSLF